MSFVSFHPGLPAHWPAQDGRKKRDGNSKGLLVPESGSFFNVRASPIFSRRTSGCTGARSFFRGRNIALRTFSVSRIIAVKQQATPDRKPITRAIANARKRRFGSGELVFFSCCRAMRYSGRLAAEKKVSDVRRAIKLLFTGALRALKAHLRVENASERASVIFPPRQRAAAPLVGAFLRGRALF